MKTFIKTTALILLLLSGFIIHNSAFGQNVGINATGAAPNASAMLDVNASDKGMLIPRVALTGTTDIITITSPVTSLLVYNTTAAGTPPTNVVPGYYFWNGTYWALFSTSIAVNPVFGNLALGSGTATALYTPYVNLQKGVYLCYFYKCLDASSTDYYFNATAESSIPANIYSGFLNIYFSQLNWFTNTPFVLYVRADGTPVRFVASNGAGGTISQSIPSNCSMFVYYKISE